MLADLPGMRIDGAYDLVQLGTENLFRRGVIADLSWNDADDGIVLPDHRRVCPVLHRSFHAELAGLEVAILDRGHWSTQRAGSFGCAPARITFLMSDDFDVDDAQLLIKDDSQTVTIPLGASLQQRTIERIDGGSWTFQKHDMVRLAWSHPGDLGDLYGGVRVVLIDAQRGQEINVDSYSQQPDGTMYITLPDAAMSGTMYVHNPALSATGPNYQIDVTLVASHAITITP